jgi:hypothetical protein
MINLYRYLMDINADFNNGYSNVAGHRPIHWACVKGRIEIVNLLSSYY